MAGEIIYNNFEKSLVVFMPNIISLQIMLLPILSPFSKLISIHFLTELQPFSLGDHFIYSHKLFFKLCIDFVRRKVMLITLGTKGLTERRSRHVTLPLQQNFWMKTNRKRHLKSESHMLAKFSRVESERTVSECRRQKRQLLCCVPLLHKASV